MPNGGPDGGDGGRGGNIVLIADVQLQTLSGFRDRRAFRADNGRPGAGSLKHGADGRTLELRVPRGTVVRDIDSGEILGDLLEADERLVVCHGGRGGRGNTRFTSSTHQAPRIGELGAPGESRRVHLELKLIADIGLVGLPNAGKSTLLAALTGARPKVAAYPFTTLTPNLGVAELEDGSPLVIADVPGLIEGASTGAGLGTGFLRHLDRTRVLLHLVDVSEGAEAADAAQAVVEAELASWSDALRDTPRLLVLTKLDLPGATATADALLSSRPQAVAVAAPHGLGTEELLLKAASLVRSAAAGPAPPAHTASSARRRLGTAASSAPGGGHRRYSGVPGVTPVGVERRGGVFVVSGEGVERDVAMTDMESEEAVARLQRRLQSAGVDDALAAAGVEDGDTVRIGNVEFDWVRDGTAGVTPGP